MPRQAESILLPHAAGGHLALSLSQGREPADCAVVYVHGFGSTRAGEKSQALEAACARRGWSFAAFDFRGHGQSTGTLLELRGTGLLADLETVRDYLAGRGIRRLCLLGSSMGGWASAWFAVQHPESVLGCALIAPAFDFLRGRWSRLTEAEQEAWKRTGRLRVRNDWVDTEIGYGIVEEINLFPVDDLAEKLACPTLIFHGMRDDVVPYEQSLSLVERASYPVIELRLYRDGDHRLLAYKDEMAEATCSFFARSLRERGS